MSAVEHPAGRTGLERRTRTLLQLGVAIVVVLAVAVLGTLLTGIAADADLPDRNQPPSLAHWFGTDRYGRDLLARTLVGLKLSLVVGTGAAVASGLIAALLALVAVAGGRAGRIVVNWLVDLFLALPHLVLLIMITFALGGGTTAVVIAIAVTHWPRLTRVLVAVATEGLAGDHVALSRALGHSRTYVARRHLLPTLWPQLSVGVVLMFPHAILHEAALSFLGLGIDPSTPAVGVLLSESMRSLSAGYWWLAALPGLALLVVVKLVDTIGNSLRALIDPEESSPVSDPLLDVEDLRVTFRQYERGLRRREVTAISSMSLRVRTGELIALVGASGAGKSLLGHAVLGMLPANATSAGTVRVRGEVADVAARRAYAGREIALLPQSVTYLDPTATVGTQVRRAAKLAGLSDPKGAAATALADRGLAAGVEHRYPHQLSGGMARRVIAAIALIGTPALVIADEPTPGLPTAQVTSTLAGLREIARGDRGVLLITHDLLSALEVADRVVVCDAGRTLEEAPVEAFTGAGDDLKEQFSRDLWRALPSNGMCVP